MWDITNVTSLVDFFIYLNLFQGKATHVIIRSVESIIFISCLTTLNINVISPMSR